MCCLQEEPTMIESYNNKRTVGWSGGKGVTSTLTMVCNNCAYFSIVLYCRGWTRCCLQEEPTMIESYNNKRTVGWSGGKGVTSTLTMVCNNCAYFSIVLYCRGWTRCCLQEEPTMIESYNNKRTVGWSGGEGVTSTLTMVCNNCAYFPSRFIAEDEHDVVWFWLQKDKPHECPVYSQYFVVTETIALTDCYKRCSTVVD
jgi:hypothetical protein